MVITIIIIVVLIGSLIFMNFARDMIKDKQELKEHPLHERYNILMANVNAGILGGRGELKIFDDQPRLVNMMDQDRPNIMIQFYYVSGSMTIALLYLFLHRRLVFKKTFHRMNNASNFLQRDVANEFVGEALAKMVEHQRNVAGLGSGYAPKNQTIKPSSANLGDDPGMMAQETLYGNMTQSQKNSMANMIYLIMKADGTPDSIIYNNPVFSAFVRNLGVNTSEAKAQFLTYGEQGIIADLIGLGEPSTGILIMIGSAVCIENGRPIGARDEKFAEMLDKLGIDEQEMSNRIEKMKLLNQMFRG